MIAQDFRLQCLSSLQDMEAISEPWQALENSLADGLHIFQTYQWCKIWADHFVAQNKGFQLALYVGWDGDELSFVCPLVIRRHGPLRIGHWVGEPFTQYGTALVKQDGRQDQRLALFWAELGKAKVMDAVWFRYIRQDSCLAPYLCDKAILLKQDQACSLGLSAFSNWDEMEQWFRERHSKTTRRNRARNNRRLLELGTIEMRLLEKSQDLQQALDDVLAFKAKWLEESGLRSSTFADEDSISVLRSLIENDHPNSACRFYGLYLDGKAVAYDIGFTSFGRFLGNVGAFHPDYKSYSPGIYLMQALMLDLEQSGFDRFDLMSPVYDYKARWCKDLDDIMDYGLALNWRGQLYVNGYLMQVRPLLKSLLDHMPAGLQAFIQRFKP